ncbi:MAG TPA: PLP-dependent aspartate aminotransferase family protein [Candidatus Ozemobacteraceae bacterium]|nr:PLP-dependent aspartate aminotransferase family protein [Candidatus Ozemobacteraceae bacterium]HQG28169.1 PLP-dependent aspartate aminotransferase family protein [Candidatus Ozemobacteraceae bacterium]
MKKGKTGFDTDCIHAGQHPDKLYGGVSVPIFQSSTFAFENAAQGAARFSGQDSGYKYTRLGNPTTAGLEECVAELEGGGLGLATASGMAAVSTVFMAFLGQGVHMVATDSVYGPTRTLAENELSRFGVESTFLDTTDLNAVKKAMKPNTKLVYLETPGNPTLSISDIAACAKIAHANGAILVVDNTFCSPMLQKPLDLGADVVLHSMTKFLNGHSDVVAGIIVARDPKLFAQMKKVLVQMGGTIDPHQAWLVLRGIKTLGMRVRVAQDNAMKLANDLLKHPAVAWVKYPGLPSHPQHELAKKQMKGFGAMISFELKGGVEAGRILMDTVKLSTLAVSLGGVETLIQHPASMTHASMGPKGRQAAGISDGLVRFSVGCEDYEDIRDDLVQALDKVLASKPETSVQIAGI